jgi:hypothetical protein
MFIPTVEIARLCRRLRVAHKTNIYVADAYWRAIDQTIAEIQKRK